MGIDMRKELQSTQELVLQVLFEDAQARESDNHLYYTVCSIIASDKGIDLDSMNLCTFLKTQAKNGFPAFETVRRTRQKMQALYPELSAGKTIRDIRKDNQEIFRKFAGGK